MGRPSERSLPDLLYRRQLGSRRLHALTVDLQIVKALLQSKNREHRCIGTLKSRQPITYHASRLYTTSFTVCRSLIRSGRESDPNEFPVLYRMPRVEGGNLNDAMLYSIPYPWSTPRPEDAAPTLLRLSNSRLERCDLDTGRRLQEYLIGAEGKFKYLSWNEPCHSIVLKSKKKPQKVGPRNETVINLDFLLFGVAPLKPHVAITFPSSLFHEEGQPAVREFDVNIDNFLLVVTVNKFVQLYSFKTLLQKNKASPVPPKHGIYGFESNVEIKTMPPCLLRLASKLPENITFGGFPLHVIFMTEDGSFHLQRVGEDAPERIFRPQDPSIDQEAVVFANNFEDVIYWRGSHFFRIWSVAGGRVRQTFELTCQSRETSQTNCGFSRFGRPLHRRARPDFSSALSPTVLYLAYDDDLDLLVLLLAEPRPGAESFLYADFRESDTGAAFRSTPLLELTDDMEDQEWTLQADLNYLVLTSQRDPNEYSCRVYELLEK